MSSHQIISQQTRELDHHLSATVNYSHYLNGLIELGNKLKKAGNHQIYLPYIDQDVSKDPETYQKILEAGLVFIQVWRAKELAKLQLDSLDGNRPYLREGTYPSHEKKCRYVIDLDLVIKVPAARREKIKKPFVQKNTDELNNLKIGKKYKAFTKKLRAYGAYYIRNRDKLFYVKNADPYTNEVEVELVSNDFKIDLPMEEHTGTILKNDQLLEIAKATHHTHIVDQRNFAANFNVNRSIQKAVNEALKYMEQYYDLIEIELDKQSADKRYALKKNQERKNLEAHLLELDHAAFAAIRNYRTNKQTMLMGLGFGSGIFASIVFGFVEGSSAMLAFLSGLGVILLIAKIVAYIWGIGSFWLQWETMRSGTGQFLIDAHGKDKFGEGFFRYHNATGFHELSPARQRKLKIGAAIFFVTGLAMGALAQKSLSDLAILFGFGTSLTLPPVAMIGVIMIVAMNVSYMFAKGYEKLLKSNKSIWEYLTSPFRDTLNTVLENKNIKHKNCAIIVTGLVFTLAYFIGIAGLIVSGITASHSLATISNTAIQSGPVIAKWIGIALGDIIGVIGRFVFTIDRANTAAKTITQVSSENRTPIFNKKLAPIAAMAVIQSALFSYKEDPFHNKQYNALGSTMTSGRDAEGFFGKPQTIEKETTDHPEFRKYRVKQLLNHSLFKKKPGWSAKNDAGYRAVQTKK